MRLMMMTPIPPVSAAKTAVASGWLKVNPKPQRKAEKKASNFPCAPKPCFTLF
jgi:hypothetical protein